MTTGVYPDVLKIAKVSALHKRGSTEEVNNYRPISVLSPFNKIFETILYRRLTKFWDKYKIYTPSQLGFCSEHSTTLAINQLYETFLDNADKSETTSAIFIDLSKAFDTVNHDILLKKLEYYGVRGIVNNLFRSYLTNRKQYVMGNNISSSLLPITIGVPQGSVLGLFLFAAYINDITECSSFKTFL